MKSRFSTILIIILCHFQVLSQTENEQEKYRILTYGYPSGPDDAETVVNQKWNIEKVAVAGCVVTRKLIDSVKTHNTLTWELIERDNQIQNSELKYRNDIINTRRDLEELKLVVYNNELTNGLWKNLKNKKDDYLIFEEPKFISASKYSIYVKKRKRKIDEKPTNKVYNLIVDLSSESITVE